MELWLGLALALISAITDNWAYSREHGDAFTGAGLATLTTNAVPIAAGFAVFGEQLPNGARGVFQPAAFAALIVSAVPLAHTRTVQTGATSSAASSTAHVLTG